MTCRHHREQLVLVPGMRLQPSGNPVTAGDDAKVGAPL